MKELSLILILILTVNVHSVRAQIAYNVKEYKPKGKHFDTKVNIVYYGIYSTVTTDLLTLLYYTTSNNNIVFKGFWVSKSLEAKLPMVVVRYIGNIIVDTKIKQTHSLKDALEITKQVVDKALDKTWLNKLKDESISFSDRDLYKRDFAGFDMNYYEFFPLEKNGLVNPSEIEDEKILESYSNAALLPHKVILETNKVLSEAKDDLLKKPDFDKTVSWQKPRYDNLKDVIDRLSELTYHHKDLKVSDWPLASPTKWLLSGSSPSGFHSDADSTCKYLMLLQQTLKKEEYMPAMAWKQNYGNWKPTRCNMFAGDFTQQTLGLSTYPWGTKDWNANSIHANLPTLKDFIPVTWDKAWEYTNMGYPVFITTPKPDDGPAGHIAIAYPIDTDNENKIKNKDDVLDDGMVVQAGNSNGLMPLSEGFPSTLLKSQGKVYIYLGYLK
ncbi:MAG: hypothetical protein K2U26_18360 [Cyclobacteriaceae bacterium]|nr:hypothetical protein [Chitinophagaceae bacterium]MBY0436059.1 hypothetical protein [Cyclobacteriaceae bacterium]